MANSEKTTVIICAAGMGTRLGIGTTKSLLKIGGKSLITRLLEGLNGFDDVRIVVGFQAERVIEKVNAIRKDILFAFNYDYETTGPAESVSKALLKTRENVVIIDGDIVINPEDFRAFLDEKGECVGISKRQSSEPVYVKMGGGGDVVGFSKEDTGYEWVGIMKVKGARLKKTKGFVYEMVEPLLPIKCKMIRMRDIDTIEDYEDAERWVQGGCK